MTWTVEFTRRAYKQLQSLPHSIQDIADLAVADLEVEGVYPRGWNCRKTGDGEYRLRLNYRYRMRFHMIDTETMLIEVFYVGHRREAYR